MNCPISGKAITKHPPINVSFPHWLHPTIMMFIKNKVTLDCRSNIERGCLNSPLLVAATVQSPIMILPGWVRGGAKTLTMTIRCYRQPFIWVLIRKIISLKGSMVSVPSVLRGKRKRQQWVNRKINYLQNCVGHSIEKWLNNTLIVLLITAPQRRTQKHIISLIFVEGFRSDKKTWNGSEWKVIALGTAPLRKPQLQQGVCVSHLYLW